MKLKRICKVEYEDGVAVIPQVEKMRYDIYFVDTEDWLCIDEDDYMQEKFEARLKDMLGEKYAVYQDNGNGIINTGYIYTPYIPMHIVDEMVTIKR